VFTEDRWWSASLTITTNVTFLKGAMAANQPLFMPGLNEAYEKKP
jgi:hypothetical protein